MWDSFQRLMPFDQSKWSLMNVFVQPNLPTTNDTKAQRTDSQLPSNHSTPKCEDSIRIEPCQDIRDLNEDGLSDCTPGGAIMCTVWHNLSQPLNMDSNISAGRQNVFQTWNPWIKPRSEKVFVSCLQSSKIETSTILCY